VHRPYFVQSIGLSFDDVPSKHHSVHLAQPTCLLLYLACRFVDYNKNAADGCEAQVKQFIAVRSTSQLAANGLVHA
jgi:hypothetical protein